MNKISETSSVNKCKALRNTLELKREYHANGLAYPLTKQLRVKHEAAFKSLDYAIKLMNSLEM
tara:strand:- start:95 stop:283 length:189 start_codon:yes stop_codon:yes gene_type:complete